MIEDFLPIGIQIFILDFDDTGSITDNDMDHTQQDQSDDEVIDR